MNNFQDHGIILSVRGHGESGAIVSIFTEEHGKCSGYVNGARSSARLRSTLQQGQCVSVTWTSKSEDQLGRFDIESDIDITARLMDNSKTLLAVQSVCALIDGFLPERELHGALYHGTRAFIDLLGSEQWAPTYIYWEMAFLKELGYGIDLSTCAASGETESLTYVSPKSGRAVCDREAQPYKHKLLPIPAFMQGKPMADEDIAVGLKLTGHFLIHRLLQHSSYHTLPEARLSLENAFNPSKITE
ncbi:MAG: DNA repair protein RecO [Alphaproteobacteria bacterium]|nr:MAG: DNA repair protein RecO [Alphaproteobacteria bacterium]